MNVGQLITRLEVLDPELEVGLDATEDDDDGRYYTPTITLEIRQDAEEGYAVAVLGWIEKQ